MDETHSAKIRIRLLDNDESPVADTGITVSVEGSSAESVTDIEGRASFPKARVPSQIGIKIDFPEREVFETSVLYDTADEEYVIRLPFHIERKGILCVKVEDSNGKALIKNPIQLEIEDLKFDDVTDDEGKSVFSDIPIGKRGTLFVRSRDGDTIEHKLLLKSSEETVTIVSEVPVKSHKKRWIGVCLFVVLSVVIAAYLMFRSEPTNSREQPPAEKNLVATPGDCQCEEDIEELRREINRLEKQLSEISRKIDE